VVHNAETLAHAALIARHGARWFRDNGRGDSPGTCLVTVSGGVVHGGVYEVALGSPVRDIVERAGPRAEVAAVLVGGFGGTFLDASVLDTPFAPGPLARVGAGVGAGVLVVIPTDACGITETAVVASYMAGESAGQCGPCVFGLPAVAEDMTRLARGTVDAAVLHRLERRCAQIDGRGACRHPDGVVRMVGSALGVFARDAADHAAGRPCAHSRSSMLAPGVGQTPRRGGR
jgi:NADH:ubiquinone oxidoreductase subunit F (NADH-binding)